MTSKPPPFPLPPSGSAGSTPGSKPTPPPPPPRPSNPFGSNPPRFGARASADLVMLHDHVLRVDLRLVGSSLYTLIGLPTAEIPPGEIEPFLKALETDKALHEPLREQLDTQWATFNWRGAVLAYTWTDASLNAITNRLSAARLAGDALRVVDPLLALNLLGRVRGSLLLPRSPVVLERGYLSRSLVVDDLRVIRFALQHGSVSAPLIDPQPEPEAAEPSED